MDRAYIKFRGRIILPSVYFFRTLKYYLFLVDYKKKKQNKISILCPSRERPNNLIRLIKNINDFTKIHERVELVVYVDNDDPLLMEYRQYYEDYNKIKNNINYKLLIGEPKSVSKSWNDIAKLSIGDILIMGNDDCIFETKGWDQIVDVEVAKFPDKIFVMWFNDGLRAHMYGDFPIVSREWYKILGYFTPGCFEFTFNDTWINDLGKRVRRLHYVKKVKLTHLHADIGLQEKDNTWKKHRSGKNKDVFQRDEEKYNRTSNERKVDANKILDYLKLKRKL